jgi:DNA primase
VGIVEEDIAKVRAATDFVALASEHLALRRVGTRWVGLCPFHSEKTPSFSVNAELGMYYCFGCGAKGDAITFLREMEHLDFVDAVQKLADRVGMTLRYDNETAGRDHQRRSRIYETLDQAIAWYHERLLSGADGARARAYLRRERGYDGETVRRFRLGWAPEGWDQLVRTLGIPAPALVDAGLATVDESARYTDFFRGRILFPIFEAGGKPVGAGGRLLPGGRGPKYKNTAGTAVYDKSRVLYGLNWAKKSVVEKGQVVVCEGYTDVIGLQLAGVGEAVATCGTALADGHIKLLTNFARRIVLAYDADAAGRAAAERFYEWEDRYQVDIRVAALPPGTDPADLARQDPAAAALAVAEARPYLGWRLDRVFERFDMANPEGRVRAAEEALSMISGHPNELVRDQYLMQIAERSRVEVDALRRMAAAGRRPGGSQNRGQPVATERDRVAPVAVSGPELEALRLAVQHPEQVASRLDRALFTHPLALAALDSLSAASTLHEAIETADPQTGDLLQRLAVEESDADTDDVLIRLVERATQRAVRELTAEMRQADPSDQASYPPTIAWLKMALETMKTDDISRRPAALEAEERLVAWIVAREQAVVPLGAGHPETEA